MFNFKRKKAKSIKSNSQFAIKITKYLNPMDVKKLFVIDIGANKGDFFDKVCSIYKKSVIKGVLIEPLPSCINLLNEKYSNQPGVNIYNIAISNTKGEENFNHYKFDETSSLLKIKQDLEELSNVNTELNEIIKVDVCRLDDILFDNEQLVDLLKIDVQGNEHNVIEGAKSSLSRIKYIWTEVSFKALYEGSSTFVDIYNQLQSLGFNLLEVTDGHRGPNYELLQTNCLFKNNSL